MLKILATGLCLECNSMSDVLECTECEATYLECCEQCECEPEICNGCENYVTRCKCDEAWDLRGDAI